MACTTSTQQNSTTAANFTTAPAMTQTQGFTAPAMTQVHGFSVQITGFIPVPNNDMRQQLETPLLLLDIREGRKSLAEVIPLLRGVEFRQQHVEKRMTVDEFNALQGLDKPAVAEEKKETTAIGDKYHDDQRVFSEDIWF